MVTLLLALTLTAAPVNVKVELRYTLVNGAAMKCVGKGCPAARDLTPMSKTWFFTMPQGKSDKASIDELLHRVFFDANAVLRAREPTDPGYMKLVDYTASKFDEKSMLTAKSVADLPWRGAAAKVIWERSCCYAVDAQGNWDTLEWDELTELFAFRLLDRKGLDEQGFLAFWKRIAENETSGPTIFKDKATRQANLVVVRPHPENRKPGSKPIVSASDELH